jgi:hypothetical protein
MTTASVETNPRVTGILVPVRRLHTSTTQQATTGTSEETLASYTLPGGTLAANGQKIVVVAFGTLAANANAKIIDIDFGSTNNVVFNTTLNNARWRIQMEVWRTGATTQKALVTSIASSVNGTNLYTTPTETLSGNVVIAIKGTTASAIGDIVFEGWDIHLSE